MLAMHKDMRVIQKGKSSKEKAPHRGALLLYLLGHLERIHGAGLVGVLGLLVENDGFHLLEGVLPVVDLVADTGFEVVTRDELLHDDAANDAFLVPHLIGADLVEQVVLLALEGFTSRFDEGEDLVIDPEFLHVGIGLLDHGHHCRTIEATALVVPAADRVGHELGHLLALHVRHAGLLVEAGDVGTELVLVADEQRREIRLFDDALVVLAVDLAVEEERSDGEPSPDEPFLEALHGQAEARGFRDVVHGSPLDVAAHFAQEFVEERVAVAHCEEDPYEHGDEECGNADIPFLAGVDADIVLEVEVTALAILSGHRNTLESHTRDFLSLKDTRYDARFTLRLIRHADLPARRHLREERVIIRIGLRRLRGAHRFPEQ